MTPMTSTDLPERPAGMPEPPVALMLITAGRLVSRTTEVKLKSLGISLRHVSALGHLSRHPGLSYSELARRAGITVQSMQATLRQLEDRAAVEGSTEPGRGKAARLHVTAAGRALLHSANKVFTAVEHDILDGLPPDQRASLATALLTVLQPARQRIGATAPRGPRAEDVP